MEKLYKESFPIDLHWIKRLLAWADNKFPYMAYFNPNSIPFPYNGFEQIFFSGEESFPLAEIKEFPDKEVKVGILGYDLKNQFERLQSNNPSLVNCPDSLFFIPTLKVKFKDGKAEIFHSRALEIFEEIQGFSQTPCLPGDFKISACTTKEEYIQNVRQIKNHIIEGDIYEMNYCMAFKATFNTLDPVQTYFKLTEKSPMPFSTFFKGDKKYVIGASPERFLKRSGSKIIAQPIKGTVKRGSTPEIDKLLRLQLLNSEKERAENLMIVDLMRNDLSRISKIGKVKVEELFGIYSFQRISQMISTVSSTLKDPISFEEIIEKTFPMGSMTGAPKIKCMELIDRYENFRRGWFSGAIGYISANQDFDFNVVIRSIIMDKGTGQLFFAVGSAITFDADPVHEYKECLLKAQPIFEVLHRK
ncbi:MAG: anthranilate synthase component I family protein [Anditalea sp.]